MNQYLRELKKITDNYENYQQVEDLQQHLSTLISMIDNDVRDDDKTPVKASDLVSSVIAKFFKPNSEIETIKSGFASFDRLVNGFYKGEFVVVGARPGMGKTQFMVQLAINISKQNIGVAFFSFDAGAEMMTQKFLCNLGQLNPWIFNKPESYNNDIELSLSGAIKQLKELPIYLYENPNTHLNKLLTLIKNVVNDNQVRVVFIDYLQLISVGNRRLNREAEISIICRELKKLTMELDITLIVSSQLSRQVENRPGGSRRPQLSDLRESGAIEQDADKVIFIYRAEYYGIEVDENNQSTRNRMELILGKNKNGPIVDVNVIAAFSNSMIVDEEYTKEHIYMRTPDIKIDTERLKDLNSTTRTDIDEVF